MPDTPAVRSLSHSTFVRRKEHPRSWLYVDPFVGALWVYKTDLPDPPPLYLRVTVEMIDETDSDPIADAIAADESFDELVWNED